MSCPGLTVQLQPISECFIKPQYISEEDTKRPIHLSPWDLALLSVHYIHKGLLFAKPASPENQDFSMGTMLQELKRSLSATLTHFYPLAARLATHKQQDPPSYFVFIDSKDSPGAKFIYATLDLTVSDILSPIDVPLIVQSFFDHDKSVNHDGHTMPLLSVQVTELIDGIFIGCSFNHVVADGTSFWHFFNTWSEVFRAKGAWDKNSFISQPPIHQRWVADGHDPIINLPFTHHDQFISRHVAPQLRERIFHFSSDSLSKLKAKANSECKTTRISSLQALSALVWRCVTRARCLPPDTLTSCRLAANNRSRLAPPLSNNYFGNCMQALIGTAAAGELLEHGLGWAAWQLHEAVANQDDRRVREFVESWFESPAVYNLVRMFDPASVMMGSSPRFDMYGSEFGLGKALAIRSGYANKFDGKVSLYPGIEGGGSMDLEVCLLPENMKAFEFDEEFKIWILKIG